MKQPIVATKSSLSMAMGQLEARGLRCTDSGSQRSRIDRASIQSRQTQRPAVAEVESAAVTSMFSPMRLIRQQEDVARRPQCDRETVIGVPLGATAAPTSVERADHRQTLATRDGRHRRVQRRRHARSRRSPRRSAYGQYCRRVPIGADETAPARRKRPSQHRHQR